MIKQSYYIDWPKPLENWLKGSELARLFLLNLGVGIIYVALAALSTMIVNRPAVNIHWIIPVWLPDGFATFALLRIGKRSLPGVFVGSIIANAIPWIDGMAPILAILVSLGNVVSIWIAYVILKKIRPSGWYFNLLNDVLLFIFIMCILGSLISGLWGATVITVSESFLFEDFFKNWITWSFGDMASVLEVTPFLLLWSLRWDASVVAETETRSERLWWPVALVLLGLTAILFFAKYPADSPLQLLDFLISLPFMWALSRFSYANVYFVDFLAFLIASVGTAVGYGPFQDYIWISPDTLTQFFMAGMAALLLFLGAMMAENHQGKMALLASARELDQKVRERTVELHQTNEHLVQLSLQNEKLMQYQAAAVKFQQELLYLQEPQMMYERLVDIVVNETDTLGAFLTVPESDSEWLRVVAVATKNNPLLQRTLWQLTPSRNEDNYPFGAMMASIAFREKKPQDPRSPLSSMAMRDLQQLYPGMASVQSTMAYPIFSDDPASPVAIMVFLSEFPDHFTDVLKGLLGQLCVSLGLALGQWQHHQDLIEAESRIHNLAFYDPLTHLPNRRLLESRMEEAAARKGRVGKVFAVCILDLDYFKPINDTYGHESGDFVLVTIGQRLLDILRVNDVVARLGGDEFVLLLDDLDARSAPINEKLTKILSYVQHTIEDSILLPSGDFVQVGVSIGVFLVDEKGIGTTPNQWLRYADQALYKSKRHKLDRDQVWMIFDQSD